MFILSVFNTAQSAKEASFIRAEGAQLAQDLTKAGEDPIDGATEEAVGVMLHSAAVNSTLNQLAEMRSTLQIQRGGGGQ